MAEHEAAYIDHVETGQSRIPQRPSEIEPYMNLVASILDKYEVLEQVIWGLLNGSQIDFAGDAVLDIKGKQIGCLRDGRTTEDYRAAIKSYYAELMSGGDPESLIAIVKSRLKAVKVTYHDYEYNGSKFDNILFAHLDYVHDEAQLDKLILALQKRKSGAQTATVITLDKNNWWPDRHPLTISTETYNPINIKVLPLLYTTDRL